uniref:E3 ubiquitin-protein ligase listerin n=1 Tax=Oryza meridionalis TaxID=40149 RepID=A0A0E0EXA1_9ORYZ
MRKHKGRAASSGLAASLLPHAQGAVPIVGFGGYHGASRVEPAAPSSSTDPDASILLPPDVDSEVLQHLRRLGRKDPTTKLKALSTLSMLFAQKPGQEVVQIVPQWAFEYKRLLLDYNREVRRATHDTMSSLVKTVKKGLAPHLKALMGPWWFSQFDPALEVAQAARHSFEAAFPQSDKRLDALMLCVKETFLHLNENLKLTTQALSDKATPMDELEDMHQRVISSSLLAMATLIDILLGVKLQNCVRDNSRSENKSLSKVLSGTLSSAESAFSMNKYFLDFLKSKSAIIRSASYSLLASYIKHVSHVFNEEAMKVLSPALLGAFNEKDASCHSSMWDAFLAFSRRFPEAWSYCNIHKVVFSRFWHFLQNGCYGSKQASYPLLVQFLESIPSKAVTTEQFVFDFLHNLWAGRNQRQLSAADSLAFFTTFKQSFLWLLKVLPRHSGGGSSDDIPIKLITYFLAKVVWHDYLRIPSSKNQDISLSGLSDEAISGDCQLSHKESLLASSTRYPTYYLQDLGKCIIEILDEISAMENHLLNIACETLLKDCLDIIHQRESLSNFQYHVEQVVSFFISLDQLIVQKGKTWPLESLARPLIEQSVPAIKSMDTPIVVKLLSVLVEIFRPVPLFLKNSQKESEESVQGYLDVFNGDFVPWCLDRKYSTCSSKIDLLLSLIIDECFFDQWCTIIKYTSAKQKHPVDNKNSHVDDQFELLALILQKVRERIAGGKLRNLQKNGSLPEHWQHDLLDSAAESVFCDLPATDSHCLTSVLMTSTFEWARFAYVVLLPTEPKDSKVIGAQSFSSNIKMAHFAFKVLGGSLFALRRLEEDSLFPSVLAALFIIEWEYSMALTLDEEHDLKGYKEDIDVGSSACNSSDDHLDEGIHLKANLAESIHTFCQSLSPSFWSDLHPFTLNNLCALFQTVELPTESTSVLCSEWMVNMLKLISLDHTKLQSLFYLLLSEGEYWPLWVKPSLQNENAPVKIKFEPVITNETGLKHHQFVAFVDKLVLNLGFGEVILGVPGNTCYNTSQSIDTTSTVPSLSRAWVAAEILCTWKWKGGSVFSTFLPSMIQHLKMESCAEVSILSILLDTLLEGAFHECNQWPSLAYHPARGKYFNKKYKIFCAIEAPSLSTSGTTLSTMVELLGVKLIAVMVGYCWTELQENDLHFVFHTVQKWIESAGLLVEEMTDAINDAVINQKSNEDTLEKLKLVVSSIDELTLSFGEFALVTLCHLNHLVDIQETENFQSLQIIKSGDFADRNNKMMESMLRLFLASGVSEAIAKSSCEEASSIIASSRDAYMHFWELVASFVIYASPQTRKCALESMELWGLAKGSVSGLYSILFSSQPISHLQFAAYSLLLSEPLCQFSLIKECSLGSNRPLTQESCMGQSIELMPDSEKTLDLREELSSLIEMPTSELLQTDLLAHDRHIPLRTGAPCGKKKDAELMPEAEVAAQASKNAIITCSLLPCIESLWPVGTWQMASLAGGLYGMMIRLLPSYVRTWFTSLRDRSLSSSIESFTRAWCSPPLLLDEFSQVKDSLYADDNFSVSVNRSAYEIVATYKKEETGIDLVIRLPSCYPLRHVDVECTRSLGISEVKCRKWLLSLTAFVRNQNGAIAEAIHTWKSNFDKEFEGVEECPICYSILHTSNHSLPRLACKTCRHKFHGACLYKWFSTSNKSTNITSTKTPTPEGEGADVDAGTPPPPRRPGHCLSRLRRIQAAAPPAPAAAGSGGGEVRPAVPTPSRPPLLPPPPRPGRSRLHAARSGRPGRRPFRPRRRRIRRDVAAASTSRASPPLPPPPHKERGRSGERERGKK